ncbi:hypothetical protein CR983_02665 [Candidatus Saccharibacteria bacterium]|nr:MAG: hypothetical protein CR983_02665 [Candidatus Saccharibacteria bacterium]
MRLPRLHRDRLQYEFLPAAEEIVETPPSPFGRIVLWLIIIMLVVGLTWSYVGRLDVVASASGKIIPADSVKTVQAAGPGVVKSIDVSEGQSVKKGQLLIQLDPSLAKAEVKAAEQALTVARLERDILAKTLAGEDASMVVNAADIPEHIKPNLIALAQSRITVDQVQQQLLSSGLASAQQQLAQQRDERRQAEDAIAKLRAKQREAQAALKNADPIDQASQRRELDSINQQITSREQALTGYDHTIAQAQIGVDRANGELNAHMADNRLNSYSAIIDSEKRIAELESVLTRARQMAEQLSITAPTDGTILSLAVKTVGGVVNAAQPIIEIVPDEADVVVEAMVKNSDIGFVEVGQPVVVKIDTFSFQRYGYLRGTVSSISPDAISDETHGLVYRMRVAIDSRQTSKDATIDVQPGMAVTAEITTGQRRIIEFFLDPLMTHIDTSLKAR